jgi:threonine/homoserine/homoserine lactone efflux protein
MMNSLAGIFFGSFVIGLSGAIMPGPMFVVVLSQTPHRGVRTGPLTVLGHGLLESALVGAVIFGLAEIIASPKVVTTVALAGAVVLACMGIDMLRSSGRLSLYGPSVPSAGRQALHPFWAGILTSLANPFWTIWWATIGLGYLLLARQSGFLGLALFLAGHVLADLLWYSTVSTVVAGGKRWITDRIYRGMIRVCAVALFFFALYFGWHGLKGISL